MPIKTTKAYVDSKGGLHASRREAQVVELNLLFKTDNNTVCVADILDNADAVLAILSEHDDLSMVPQAPAPTPQRRLSLAIVLERARRNVPYSDDQIANMVADGSIRKVKAIGDTSYELLKAWAATRPVVRAAFVVAADDLRRANELLTTVDSAS